MTGNRFFFLLLLVLIFTQVSPALSLTTSWHKMPQNERLSLHFEKDVPPLKVTRTGYLQLTIPLPSDFWKKEKKALPAILPDSDFIKRIDFTPKNMMIPVFIVLGALMATMWRVAPSAGSTAARRSSW